MRKFIKRFLNWLIGGDQLTGKGFNILSTIGLVFLCIMAAVSGTNEYLIEVPFYQWILDLPFPAKFPFFFAAIILGILGAVKVVMFCEGKSNKA